MLYRYRHWQPDIDSTAFVAPTADIIGRVWIGALSNVWFQTTLRGDVHDIRIGSHTNIQDMSVIHTTHNLSPCIIGDHVTVGHHVILHGCEVQDRCLVGMGSVVMDQAVLEEGCFLAAGSLVPERKVLRGGYLYAGSPAREKRELTDQENAFLMESSEHYVRLASDYLNADTFEPL